MSLRTILSFAIVVAFSLASQAEIKTRRIMVIANKNWEVAPLLAVLSEPPGAGAYPQGFPLPYINNNVYPFVPAKFPSPVPRMAFGFTNSTGAVTNIVSAEIWCIQDWMNPLVSSSSSKEKMNVLPEMFLWNGQSNADLVIAFGTASFTHPEDYNGDVVLGGSAFIHDPFATDTQNSNYWHDAGTDKLIPPGNISAFFNPGFVDSIRISAEPRFVSPPMDPARKITLFAAMNNVAVSGINITNYDDYAWADPAALSAFTNAMKDSQNIPPIGSLETTHGLIAFESVQFSSPFIFISAITDRVGYFNMEVATRSYSQNFACAHNAGVVVAWLLPQIAAKLN